MSAPDIHIRDLATGTLLAIIDDYESLDTTRDLYEPGDFRLVINRYRAAATHLVKGRVLMPDADASESYLIEQIEEETNAEDGGAETMTVTGRALGCFLAERLCIPPPGQDTDKQISAKAETAMKTLVIRNAEAGADPKRKLVNFRVSTDRTGGSVVSYSARYQPVADALTEIARSDGGGWEIRKERNGAGWEFDYIPGTDRATSVFLDTTIDTAQRLAHLASDMGRKDYALVGGPDAGGQGRTFVAVWAPRLGGEVGQIPANEPASWARRELYVEGTDVDPARDGNLTALLIDKGKAAIRETGQADAYEAEMYQLGPYRYRTDFNLGDVVTVRNPQWALSQVQRIIRVRQRRGSDQQDPVTTVELGTVWPTLKGLLRKVDRRSSSAGGYPPTGAVDAYPRILSGWTAGYDELASATGEAVLSSSGVLTLGTGDDVVTLDAIDPTWRIAVGSATYAAAPFRVNKDGALFATGATITGSVTATSGTVGGWTVTSTAISNAGGTVTMRGAGNLAFGSTPPTAANAGTGIFVDNTGVYGLASSVQQFYLRASDGKAVFGAGTAVLDATGIVVSGSGTLNISKDEVNPVSPGFGVAIHSRYTGVRSPKATLYGLHNIVESEITSADPDLIGIHTQMTVDDNFEASIALNIAHSGVGTGVSAIGIRIDGLPTAGDARGIEISNIAAGANQWALYSPAGAQSAIAGNLRVGSATAPTVALDVTGAALVSSTLGSLTHSPLTNDGAALGTTALQWSDLFLAEGGVINWDNGDATLTQTGNVIAINGADFAPASSGGAALGTTALQFSNLFLAEGGAINWDNGDATLTQAANLVTLAGASFAGDISPTVTTIPAIIAPAALVDSGTVATSGTTELTILTQTLTAPPVAGQIEIHAKVVSTGAGAVAGEQFYFALYFGGAVVDEYLYAVPVNGDRVNVPLMAQKAITTAGSQIIKTTCQRISGAGSLTFTTTGLRQKIQWTITPGAGTTA